MNLPGGTRLAYAVTKPDGFDQTVVSQMSVMLRPGAGGRPSEWEVVVQELWLGEPCVMLQIYDDAFAAFHQISGFFEALDRLRPRTLVAVRGILDGLGAVSEP